MWNCTALFLEGGAPLLFTNYDTWAGCGACPGQNLGCAPVCLAGLCASARLSMFCILSAPHPAWHQRLLRPASLGSRLIACSGGQDPGPRESRYAALSSATRPWFQCARPLTSRAPVATTTGEPSFASTSVTFSDSFTCDNRNGNVRFLDFNEPSATVGILYSFLYFKMITHNICCQGIMFPRSETPTGYLLSILSDCTFWITASP